MRQASLKFVVRGLGPRLAHYGRCERAATAIEFAFVAPIIIAILLATVQVAVIYIAQSYLEAMAETGMRTVLTNNAYSLTKAQFQTAICANITALFNCTNVILDVQPITCTSANMTTCMPSTMPTFTSTGALASPTTFNVGNSGDKMRLVMMYQWPVIGGPLGLTFADAASGNKTRLLTSVQVFYKEPCLSQGANACQAGG